MSTSHREDAVQTNVPPSPGQILKDSGTELWSPQSVLATLIPTRAPSENPTTPITFFHLLERLKTTKREGWRRFGINHGESISDHMYRMSLITMLAPRSLASRLDIPRCTKMALVHDVAELLVGDITPVDGVPKPEKSRREAATMDYLCNDVLGNVDGGWAGRDIRAIWQEYEDGVSLESKFVHDVDKIELVLQMVEYEKTHEGRLDLAEFAHVGQRIEMIEVQEWCKELMAERERFWSGVEGVSGRDLKLNSDAVTHATRELQDEYYGNSQKS